MADNKPTDYTITITYTSDKQIIISYDSKIHTMAAGKLKELIDTYFDSLGEPDISGRQL